MPTARAYRAHRRETRPTQTRDRIMSAVRELLAEGRFHESTVEEVADRAGIARATLYQHFGSRVELVDAICDSFAVNPALLELREGVELDDAEAGLEQTIANTVRFWSSEDAILRQLYGVAAIDPAAQDLVDRQRADRRGELERLARRLRTTRRLKAGVNERRTLALLLMLTSYETFCELGLTGMGDKDITKTLQESARELLLS